MPSFGQAVDTSISIPVWKQTNNQIEFLMPQLVDDPASKEKKRWLKCIISNNPCLRAEHHNSHQLPSPRSWDSFPVNINVLSPSQKLTAAGVQKESPSLSVDRKHQDSKNAQYIVYTLESGILKATCKEEMFVSSFASLECIKKL